MQPIRLGAHGRAGSDSAYAMPKPLLSRSRRHPAITTAKLSLCLAIGGVSVYLFAVHMRQGAITSDWPWLWRTGQWIIGHGLPSNDLYSWTMPDRAWLLYQWLFEVMAAIVYAALGAGGMVAALCITSIVVYVLVPSWLNLRRGVPLYLALSLASATLIPVSINLGLRPMLVSCWALLVQFLVVERLRNGRLGLRPAALMLAILYALWANTHLGLTLGLLSLLLFAIGDVVDRYRGDPETASLRAYGLLLTGSAIASLANPYGWHIYSYIIKLSLKQEMNAHIHELMPPDPGNPSVMVGIALLVLFVIQWARRPQNVGTGQALHVLVLALATALSLRFIVWAGLFHALVAPALWRRSGNAPDRPIASIPSPVMLISIYCVIALIAVIAPLRQAPVRMAGCQPLAAGIRYLDRHYPANTHWFSSETTGSCTRLYAPERRVFIDTRFDMYPQPFVLRWYRAYQHRTGWRQLFLDRHIRIVLLARGAPLRPTLASDPAYRRVWHDNHSVLFERGPTPLDSQPRAHQNRRPDSQSVPEVDS